MATLARVQASAAPRPIRAWDYVTLNIYWFALSFLWNSMGPILLPILILALVPESEKGGALGILSALGLIVAIVIQPAAGAWSDARTTRWGRRRPYIVGGTLGDVVFLAVMALAPTYAILLIGYLLLQFSSNIAHGAYQGYIPELVPESKRGVASGVARLFEMVGMIVTYLVVNVLVGQGQLYLTFLAYVLFLIACMIITALFVQERPFLDPDTSSPSSTSSPAAKPTTSARPLLRDMFYSRDFFLWLVSRLLILLGGNLVRNYALYFLKDVIHVANPAGDTTILLAVIAVVIAIVVYPTGALSDRVGRKRLIILSGVLGAIGAFLLISADSLIFVLLYGAIIGLSIGIFLSVNWAWATDLIPNEEGGRFLGISNLATAGSGVVAGIGGIMLDYFNAQSPNFGYTMLFLTAGLCYLAGTGIAFGVRDVRHTAHASQ